MLYENVTPFSWAVRMSLMPSALGAGAPYFALILMHPAPISETSNFPSFRAFIWLLSLGGSDDAAHDNGPTTDPGSIREVLAKESRRLRARRSWMFDPVAWLFLFII